MGLRMWMWYINRSQEIVLSRDYTPNLIRIQKETNHDRSPGGLAETDCSISSPELVSVVPGAQKCTFLKMCLGDTDTDGLEFSLWELCLWNWI